MIVEILFILGFILSISLNIFLFIALRRALSKIEGFEEKILQSNMMLHNMQSAMREIDERGMFEKDDMVGSIFDQLHTLIKFYSKLIITQNAEEKK